MLCWNGLTALRITVGLGIEKSDRRFKFAAEVSVGEAHLRSAGDLLRVQQSKLTLPPPPFNSSKRGTRAASFAPRDEEDMTRDLKSNKTSVLT
jgi:hypothetical protein